jgi:DNA-binding transcriptional regulator PaaX
MKNKNKQKKNLREIIDDFRYSDAFSATAAKVILGLLLAGPVIAVGVAMPGLLREAGRYEKRKRYSKKQWENAYKNLKYRKLIEIIREDDAKFRVQLTNKGERRIKEFCFEAMEIKEPKKWDGKWRVLIFDIPSKPKIYNQARNALRNKIKDLGFFQMQKSVWVYPYECEDEILFVAELFQVQKHIEILTVEKLLHEEKIKREFGL